MDWNNIKESIRNGINASFVPEDSKAELIKTAQDRIKRIQKLIYEVESEFSQN